MFLCVLLHLSSSQALWGKGISITLVLQMSKLRQGISIFPRRVQLTSSRDRVGPLPGQPLRSAAWPHFQKLECVCGWKSGGMLLFGV